MQNRMSMTWSALAIFAAVLTGCGQTQLAAPPTAATPVPPTVEAAAPVAEATAPPRRKSDAAKRKLAAQYRNLNRALVKGKTTFACAHMTGDFISTAIVAYGGQINSCAEYVGLTERYNRAHPEVLNNKVSQIKIHGNRATLVDKTPFGSEVHVDRIYLVREGELWKVNRTRNLSGH